MIDRRPLPTAKVLRAYRSRGDNSDSDRYRHRISFPPTYSRRGVRPGHPSSRVRRLSGKSRLARPCGGLLPCRRGRPSAGRVHQWAAIVDPLDEYVYHRWRPPVRDHPPIDDTRFHRRPVRPPDRNPHRDANHPPPSTERVIHFIHSSILGGNPISWSEKHIPFSDLEKSKPWLFEGEAICDSLFEGSNQCIVGGVSTIRLDRKFPNLDSVIETGGLVRRLSIVASPRKGAMRAWQAESR